MTAHPDLPVTAHPPRPEDRQPCGVCLGGIGSGWLELLETGRPCPTAITNNPQRLLGALRGTFLALRAGAAFRLLQRGDQGPARGCDAVAFRGRHPVAEIDYAIADLPLAATLTAFGPLTPHDLDRATLPGALLRLRLRNLGHDPLPVEALLSWESILGVGGSGRRGMDLHADRSGTVVSAWRNGQAGGLRFAKPTTGLDQGANACGESVIAAEAPAGFALRAWAFWNALADEPDLLAALAAGRCDERFDGGPLDEVIRILSARQAKPPSWDDPDPRFGGGRSAVEGQVHPAAVLGVQGVLPPDAMVEIPFTIAWSTPHHVCLDQPGVDHGRASARHGSAAAVATRLLGERDAIEEGVRALAAHLDRGDLPAFLADKLLNDTTPVTSNSVLTADGVLHTLESTPMMFGALGTLDQRLVSHPGSSLFFPEADRSELQAFADLQDADGALSHFTGNHHTALRSAQVEYGVTRWPDLAMSFIIQVWRAWTESGDDAVLERWRGNVQRALAFLLAADRDGDGVPEGGSSWDVEHYPGCFIATATLHLATLRIGRLLAARWADHDLDGRLASAQIRAAATVQAMWAGTHYRKYHDPKTGGGSDDVFIGQLAGEWVVRQLGLEPVLPEAQARAAAATLYRLNADPGRYRLAPIQVQADGRLPPRRYSWHAWPQYTQVFLDCAALHLGLNGPALANLERFDRVVTGLNRSPWATTLWHDARTGLADFRFMGRDRYMNGPSAWWVLSALTGVTDQAPFGRLALGPAPLPGRSSGRYPVVCPRWWGGVSWRLQGGVWHIELAIDRVWHGAPSWSVLRWRGPVRSAEVDGQAVACVPADGVYADLVLPRPFTATPGARLHLALTPP